MVLTARNKRSACFISAALLLAASTGCAAAASIWESAGPFQLCLEGRYEAWLKERAELVVNGDARAGDIDDAAVARWSAGAMDACRTQTGGGDQASEARFAKHMAHWREHIYDLVRNIQKRAGPD